MRLRWWPILPTLIVLAVSHAMSALATCPAAPAVGCVAAVSGASTVRYHNTVFTSGDSIAWSWRGTALAASDFGSPITTTDIEFCLYDADGLLNDVTAPAGTNWAQKKSGFAYRNAAASFAEARSVRLTSSPKTDRARIRLSDPKDDSRACNGIGCLFHLPLRAQLVRGDTGGCWEATYSAFAVADGTRYTARSD